MVALPRLRGMYLDGLPQTVEGFVPVDLHGRVSGLGDVYAAGDITTFPIKQGGVADGRRTRLRRRSPPNST